MSHALLRSYNQVRPFVGLVSIFIQAREMGMTLRCLAAWVACGPASELGGVELLLVAEDSHIVLLG